MKLNKMLLLASMFTLFSTFTHAVEVNMTPIISYLLSDTDTNSDTGLKSLLSGKTLYTNRNDTSNTLQSWTFNNDMTSVTQTEIVGGIATETYTLSVDGMTMTATDIYEVSTMIVVTETLQDYMLISIDGGVQKRLYFDEVKARTHIFPCGSIEVTGLCFIYTYNGNGVIWTETPYVAGVVHGTYKVYYFDGTIKTETPYVNGVVEGIRKQYYESGVLYYLASYVNGLIHGDEIYYYENGAFIQTATYVNGVLHGISTGYHFESGVISVTYPYVNGVLHGTGYAYYQDGSLEASQLYIDGVGQGWIYYP